MFELKPALSPKQVVQLGLSSHRYASLAVPLTPSWREFILDPLADPRAPRSKDGGYA